MSQVSKEFAVHILNEDGKSKARHIAEAFDALLTAVSPLVVDGRCNSIMTTKLEEASFFAKKGMAMADQNQELAE